MIRQDVQSMHAYAIQPSRRPGQARRDGEPVPPAASRCSANWASGSARVAINRYPARAAADVIAAALAGTSRVPDGLPLMLGNGSDELIALLRSPATCPARRCWRRCPAS